MERWAGRVAVVTNTANETGNAICEQLLKYGLRVVSCDIRNTAESRNSVETMQGEYPGELYIMNCNMHKENDINNMFDEIVKKFLCIDICIHIAGSVHALAADDSLETEDKALAACLLKATHTMREYGGIIIHIESLTISLDSITPEQNCTVNTITSLRSYIQLYLQSVQENVNVPQNIRIWNISIHELETELCADMRIRPADIANEVIGVLQRPPQAVVDIRRMERWAGRIALVTNTANKIGNSICKELLKYGLIVVSCDTRNTGESSNSDETIQGEYPGKLYMRRCNLHTENDMLKLFDEIKNKFDGIDICINIVYPVAASAEEAVETGKALAACLLRVMCIMRKDGIIIHIENLNSNWQHTTAKERSSTVDTVNIVRSYLPLYLRGFLTAYNVAQNIVMWKIHMQDVEPVSCLGDERFSTDITNEVMMLLQRAPEVAPNIEI